MNDRHSSEVDVVTCRGACTDVSGDGDTVIVRKEFHDRSVKRVIFRRVNRDPARYWRNWIPVGTSLVEGGTVEPDNTIGVLHAKDLLRAYVAAGGDAGSGTVARPNGR